MNFDRLRAIEVFVRVVEAGGFTAASEALGVSQPSVTRSVLTLEDHLGATLLRRTTRTVGLTDDGRVFYDEARRLLDALRSAEGAVGKRAASPSGRVRLGCPASFGRIVVAPMLGDFLSANPSVDVELIMSDDLVDPFEQRIDLTVRIGKTLGERFDGAIVGFQRRALYAAPDYLQRRGRPETLADLTEHDCVVFTALTNADIWVLEGPDGQDTVSVNGRFRSNNAEGTRVAALLGAGVAFHPEWLLADDERAGRVERLLPAWRGAPMPIHLGWPKDRYRSSATQALASFLENKFAEHERCNP